MTNAINTELIENFMQENHLSKTKFCKMCRISPITFNKVMANDTSTRMITIFKIAIALKTPVHKLLK